MRKNASLSFFDIKITHENNKFVTSVYLKPTYNGVFTNFEGFIPDIYKRGLIETYFTGVSNYAPIMKMFIGKLKHGTKCDKYEKQNLIICD